MKRVFSLLLAVALFAALTLPVLAADGSQPVAPAAASVGAQVISATATDVNGGELTTIKKGDVFNVVVMIADPATDCDVTPTPTPEHEATPAPADDPQNKARYTLYNLLSHANQAGYKTAEDYIGARVISPSFSCPGVGEVGPHYSRDGSDWLRTGEDGQTLYYFYKLIFRNVTYLGGDNTFTFTVSYPESTMAQSTLSFTIGQCITAESSGGDSGEDGDGTRTPHLMVRSSSYGNSLINAGTPFTLAVTIYATKGKEALEDVTVSLNLGEGLSLAGGALSQYIGTMKANSLKEVYFTILPNISFTGGVATLSVRLQGFGAESGAEASGETAISVPIEQPDRFEITGMELSDTIYVGEGGSITVNFVNKGRNPISNLEAAITGSNLGADLPQQYLGNLAAGTESSVDFDLYPQEDGPVVGTVTLTYEAADGTLKTVVQEFSSTAEAPMMFDDPGMMGGDLPMEPEPQGGMPLWGWLLIGAGVLGGGTAGVVLLRKRSKKKKAMAALEADDEDF